MTRFNSTKKNLVTLLSYGVLFFSSSAAHSLSKPWFEFSADLQRKVYTEPDVMNEKGLLSGFGLEAGTQLGNLVSVSAKAEFYFGSLHYTGSTFDGDPIQTDTKDQIRKYHAKIYLGQENFQFITGYSQRFWSNDLVISYLRETTYHYIPFVFQYRTNKWKMSAGYNYFLKGLNKSYLSEVDPNRSDVQLKQNDGVGYELHASTKINSAANTDIWLHLSYEYWNIKDSEVVSDGVDDLVEPANNTHVYALGLSFVL